MTTRVQIVDFQERIVNLIQSAGLPRNEAQIVFDHLLDSEMSGYSSHGFMRVPKIFKDLKSNSVGDTQIENETPISVLLNGGYKTGLVVAFKAVELALSKVRQVGVGFVGGYNNTGTLGALGYFTRKIAEEGYIGFMAVASEYAMAPWGGKDPILGTNPLSFSFPNNGQPIVIDFSTSAWTYGALKIAMKENRTIPTGVVLDADGNDSTDPNAADYGSQLPIAQHKGYALALAIEILGGLYVGAKAGCQAVEGTDGFLMMAIRTDLFVNSSKYLADIDSLITEIKNSSLRPGYSEILLPGERSNRVRDANANRDYIELSQNLLDEIESLGK